MNNVNIIGRITTDLNLKEANNKKILNFSVAINDTKDKTAFIPVVAFDSIAENIAKYQKKGNQIGVSGYLQDNSYTDKQGNKRSILNVIASRVDFIGSNAGANNDKVTFNYNNNFKISDKIDDDDIPF